MLSGDENDLFKWGGCENGKDCIRIRENTFNLCCLNVRFEVKSDRNKEKNVVQ